MADWGSLYALACDRAALQALRADNNTTYLVSPRADAKRENSAAWNAAFASRRSMLCRMREPALEPSSCALHSIAKAQERSALISGSWKVAAAAQKEM